MIFRTRVPHHLADRPLVEYLSRRFTYHDVEEWRRLVAAGRVSVNGQHVCADSIVALESEVAYEPEPFDEPPADLAFRVVYDDQWLLGIDKPGDLLVHRAGRSFTHNLIYQIRAGAQHTPCPHAAAVNRLDRETSGVVLVAKDSRHCAPFSTALTHSDTHKEYLAVVHAARPMVPGTISAPIGKDPASSLHHRHAVVSSGGKEAVTRVLAVQPLGDRWALIRMEAVTGRTHQLRLHCASVGCPIVADRLYGIAADREGPVAGVSITRQALHCTSIRFRHPYTKAAVEIAAPPPADFQTLVQALAAHTPGGQASANGERRSVRGRG